MNLLALACLVGSLPSCPSVHHPICCSCRARINHAYGAFGSACTHRSSWACIPGAPGAATQHMKHVDVGLDCGSVCPIWVTAAIPTAASAKSPRPISPRTCIARWNIVGRAPASETSPPLLAPLPLPPVQPPANRHSPVATMTSEMDWRLIDVAPVIKTVVLDSALTGSRVRLMPKPHYNRRYAPCRIGSKPPPSTDRRVCGSRHQRLEVRERPSARRAESYQGPRRTRSFHDAVFERPLCAATICTWNVWFWPIRDSRRLGIFCAQPQARVFRSWCGQRHALVADAGGCWTAASSPDQPIHQPRPTG